MRLIAGACITLASLLVLAIGAPPEALAAGERGFPLLRNFTTEDFGGGAESWVVEQDRRGVIYLGNLAGVLEYDGSTWRTIKISRDSGVFSLATDSSGLVAVGGVDEIGYLAPDAAGTMRYVSLTTLLPASDRKFGEVTAIHHTASGFVFVSDTLVVAWNGTGPLRLLAHLPPGEKLSFLVGGRIYLSDSSGLQTLDESGIHASGPAEVFAGRQIDLIAPFDAGRMIVFPRDGVPLLFDGKSATPFSPELTAWMAGKIASQSCTLPDGRLVIASRRGGVAFLRADGSVDEILDTSVGLPSDQIVSCFADRDGALWLTTSSGVTRVETSVGISAFDRRVGLSGSVTSVHRYRDALYVGTTAGLFILLNEVSGRPAVAHPIAGISAKAFEMLDTADGLLVGAAGGVYLVQDGRAMLVPGTAGTTTYRLFAAADDPATVWLAMREGVGKIHNSGSGWTFQGLVDGPFRYVHFVLASGGSVYAGTVFDGAFRIDFPRGRPPHSRKLIDGETAVFPIDGAPTFQVGTRIYSLDRTGMNLIPHAGLGSFHQAHSFLLAEDARGNVWINSQPPSVAIREPSGSYRLESRLLIELPPFDIQAMLADRDGMVWFGGDRGLFRYDSELSKPAAPMRAPLIRQVTYGRGNVLYGGTPGGSSIVPSIAAAGLGRLRFDNASATYSPGVVYQYRLDPIDSEWSPWQPTSFTEFTNLREGDYTFRVRTEGVGGAISPEARYSFRVTPPWWRSRLAIAGYLVLAIALLYAIFELRHSTLALRARRLEATVVQQTEQLRSAVEQLRSAKQEVDAKNAELETANIRLQNLSIQDGLTGIANRRHLEETLQLEWNRARRAKTTLGFILMDIDQFKSLNDTLGHHEGDEALIRIARFLEASVRRAGDLAARYGGEEFALVVAGMDVAAGLRLAEEIRSGIAAMALPSPAVPLGVVTASFGVASIVPDERAVCDDLREAADRALYRSKSEGRNRVSAA